MKEIFGLAIILFILWFGGFVILPFLIKFFGGLLFYGALSLLALGIIIGLIKAITGE